MGVMFRWVRVFALLLSLLPGCFLDRSSLAVEDASIGCGQCPVGQVCVNGECQASADDGDQDGIPVERDCDDTDASIGTRDERRCRSACASGVERCEDGTWSACDAPTDCDCTSGDTRMTACPMCGLQRQRCVDGVWMDEGECTGGGACTAGTTGMETKPCGLCSEGIQTRTRTCSDSCEWSEWTEWSECTGQTAQCPPGLDETETQACGACGFQTRSRICNSTCGWDAWTEWSECDDSSAVCMPGQVDTQEEPCPCSPGASMKRTRTRACTDLCMWGEWSEWSPCASGECMPGTTETGHPKRCGGCGAQTPTRTCTAECTWGDWVDGECRETRCDGTCACTNVLGWTCCPTGNWSRWFGSCNGC